MERSQLQQMTSPSFSNTIYRQMRTTLNWGLIGAGDIARKRVAPALNELPSCTLSAVSRGRAELAESFADEFGFDRWYADWRELTADPDIDAVYIATPVYMHAQQTIAAAKAGKHVLCEKPMALNVQDSEEMIAACSKNGVKLGVAYYRRFYPVVRRIKEMLDSGDLGRPVAAQINAFEYFDPQSEDPRSWLLDPARSGGGPMMDFGCHRLEVLSHLFGETEKIESVMTSKNFHREVEDTATATIKFVSGVIANLTVSHAALEPQDTLDIFCSRGSLQVALLNKGALRITSSDSVRTEHHPPNKNLHLPLIADFTDAVIKDRKPEVTGDVGLSVAKMEAEIYKNAALP